jgi:1-acyl-sn-glycerol-3-phosphate acyltransferase
VTAAAIGYSAGAEVTERDLCYYAEISFAPHLLKTLQLPDIVATLRFASAGQVYSDRKKAAVLTQEAVVQLRSAHDGTAQ